MEAPDKIYLGVGPMSGDEQNKRYIYAEWNEKPMPLVQNIAYIRKEALLEWANGMMDCFAPGGDCSQTLQMVIKHIESL